MKLKGDELCVYCGSEADCRDHVIPVSYLALSRSYDETKQWLVPCCGTCNSLAGAIIKFSISEKSKYIKDKFKKKYSKILKHPEWTEDELSQIDYKLKNMIWVGLVAKRVAKKRLENLEKTCDLPVDWKMPPFIRSQLTEIRQIYSNLEKHKKKRKKRKSLLN